MALDVYTSCPCGSHKKLKFCCHGLENDLQQVIRHQSAKQYKQALQMLAVLEQKAPQSAWVKNLQGFTLMMDNRGVEAKEPLTRVLQVQPDNLYAISLFGLAAFLADGWKNGKQAIQRSFQRCSAEYPHILYFLARSIAQFMGSNGSPMAHRQYLALSMRMANEDNRESVFMELVDFDGDAKIPYILRGSHDLVPVSGDEAFDKEFRKGVKLAFLGCNEAAGAIFAKLAEAAETTLGGLTEGGDEAVKRKSDVATLWWNAGLCRAWDGDERFAAEALHRSAKQTDDFETSVERELLAQTLSRRGDREGTSRVGQRAFKVKSVSKLLSLLDATPLLVRRIKEAADKPGGPVAVFQVLEKAAVSSLDPAAYTLDSVPRVIADIAVFDRPAGTEFDPLASVSGIVGDTFEQASSRLTEAAGDEIEKLDVPATAQAPDGLLTVSVFEKEYLPLQWRRYFEPATALGIVRSINRQLWQKFLDDQWPETELAALGGKTPRQAMGDESLRVSLAACLQQLDVYADRTGLPFDVAAQRARFQLPAIQPFGVSERINVGMLSILQFARVPFEKLNDEQLVAAFQRATLIQHKASLKPLLLQVVERPGCHEHIELSRVYRFLSDLGSMQADPDEALRWLDKERGRSVPTAEQFEHELDCDMRELRYRLDDPHSPECNRLLKRMWEHYGTKVPELRSYVTGIVTHYKVAAPWLSEASAGLEGVGGGITSGGVWTPDVAAAEQPESAGKLWLPGQ